MRNEQKSVLRKKQVEAKPQKIDANEEYTDETFEKEDAVQQIKQNKEAKSRRADSVEDKDSQLQDSPSSHITPLSKRSKLAKQP